GGRGRQSLGSEQGRSFGNGGRTPRSAGRSPDRPGAIRGSRADRGGRPPSSRYGTGGARNWRGPDSDPHGWGRDSSFARFSGIDASWLGDGGPEFPSRYRHAMRASARRAATRAGNGRA